MTDTSTDSAAGPVAGDDPVDLVPPGCDARGPTSGTACDATSRGGWTSPRSARAASLVPLTWLLLRGSFYIDDLRAQSYAAGRAWWPFVVQSNGTHLTPGARTIDWLQVTFAPLDHGVAVAITVGIRVLLLLGAWRLLRLLFGRGGCCSCRSRSSPRRRRWSRRPPGTASRSPPSSPLWRWSGPPTSTFAGCVSADPAPGRRRGWVAAGLAFHEQSAAIVPWLFALTLVLPPPGPETERSRLSTCRGAGLARVGGVRAPCSWPMAWPMWRVRSTTREGGEALTVGLVLAMAGHHVLDGLATGLLGGPWRWQVTSPYYGIADAPRPLAVLSLAVFVGLFAWAALRNWRRATGAALLLVVTYVACVAPIAAGRLPVIGTVVALEYRFWPILVVPVLVCVLLAFLPSRGRRLRCMWPRSANARTGSASRAGRFSSWRSPPAPSSRRCAGTSCGTRTRPGPTSRPCAPGSTGFRRTSPSCPRCLPPTSCRAGCSRAMTRVT